MSASTPNAFLNIDDAHLRVTSGNVYAQGLNISGISFSGVSGLQTVTNTGNVTTNTLEFKNGEKAFVATSNVDVKGSLDVANVATIYNGSNADYDQKQKFTSTISASGNYFSNTLAVSTNGLYAIVGAHGEDKAYTFTRSGSTWTQENIFSSTAGSAFGYAVDISSDGTYAIVGGNGSVSVFYRSSGSTWDSGTTLTAGGISVTTGYGASVSISDDGSYAIVGATGQNAAYIFRRTATTTWDAGVKIALTGFTLGFSVAISGDGLYALLGAHAQHTAYVFKRTGAYIWSQQVKITESDSFGYSVALSTDGSRALIGATGGNGKAYSYERSGSDWSQNAIITASDAASGDAFGSAVSLSSDGSYTLVGAPGNEKVYTFKNAGTVWTELGIETASDATAGHVFGRSVSISGDGIYALVGASGNEAAYSYERKETLVLDVRGEANVRTLNVSDDLSVTNNILTSNNLTVTGNLNVTTIRSDSNVVAEYTGPHDRPLRKYPEVALTQNDESATSGYVASQSSENDTTGNFSAWKAFDSSEAPNGTLAITQSSQYNNTSGTLVYAGDKDLLGDSNYKGEWIKLELPISIAVKKIHLQPRTTFFDQTPCNFKIVGSNDNSSWDVLYHNNPAANTTIPNDAEQVHHMTHNLTKYYKYVALVANTTGAPISGNYVTMSVTNLELYGHEEGSGSLDTTLKTVYNAPATTGTQLKVYYDGQDYSSLPAMVTDKAGTATNATITNTGSTITFDSTYKAWTFGGSSSRTDTFRSSTLPSTFTGNQVHSITLWFNMSNISDGSIFVITPSTGENGGDVIMGQTQGNGARIAYSFWGNDVSFVLPTNLTTKTWYHLSMTYDATDNNTGRKMFLNGIECTAINTASGSLSLPNSNMIISFANRVSQTSYPFFGSIANFRLYSKALNTEQVQELYDYQKDYFLGSKSQVTLYKGHLGVGVTEPSGQLELVGDERLQEYPPGPMDDYDTNIPGHGVFKAYASTDFRQTPYRSWNAFDKTITTVGGNNGWASKNGTWLTDGTTTPVSSLAANFDGVECHWLALQLPYEVKPTFVTLQARNDAQVPGEVPAKGRIYGSKDGVTWNQIRSYDIRTEVGTLQASTDNAPIPITLTTNEYYTHLLLTVDERYGGSGAAAWTDIGELRYFGTPGPTTLDKGSLTLGRSLDVPRVSRYDMDTETPRPERLVVDFDTTVNRSPTDISGKGNHGTLIGATYSPADKAFEFVSSTSSTVDTSDTVRGTHGLSGTRPVHSHSVWFKQTTDVSDYTWVCAAGTASNYQQSAILLSGNSSYPNRITFDCYNGWVTSTVTAELNRWYHVVATFNGETNFNTTNCRIYVDGVDCTGPTSEVHNGTFTFNLQGAILALGSTHEGTRGLTGLVSNYKLYDVVLEPSEVKKLYNLGRTGRSMVITDTAVGIGKVPEAQLDVRGNLNVDGVITSKNFMFHATGPVVENKQKNTSNPVVTSTYRADFSRIVLDYGSGYDTTNKVYTVPCSGYWEFDYIILGRNRSGGWGYIMGRWVKNNSTVDYRAFLNFSGTGAGCQEAPLVGKFIDYFNKGDTVGVNLTFNTTTTDVYMNHQYCHFYGKMLH